MSHLRRRSPLRSRTLLPCENVCVILQDCSYSKGARKPLFLCDISQFLPFGSLFLKTPCEPDKMMILKGTSPMGPPLEIHALDSKSRTSGSKFLGVRFLVFVIYRV